MANDMQNMNGMPMEMNHGQHSNHVDHMKSDPTTTVTSMVMSTVAAVMNHADHGHGGFDGHGGHADHDMTTTHANSHAGHAGHDMTTAAAGGHGSHSDGSAGSHGMAMTFFDSLYGYKILFDTWSVDHPWQFALTLIGVFIMGFVYEGLKVFRAIHFQNAGRNMFKKKEQGRQQIFDSSSSAAECCQAPNQISQVNTGFFSAFHLVQTTLHLLLVTLSYLLMLAVMSFQVWVFVAGMLGLAAGYLAFGHLIKPGKSSCQSDAGCCS